MATFDSVLVSKKNNQRGLYAGKLQSVTGVLRLAAGASIATTDLIRMVPVGENVRPLRVVVSSTPVSGTPVLTNPTFAIGVAPKYATATVRPDGTSYPLITASTTALVASLVIDADNMATSVEVKRPVADAVSRYAQYYITMTPAGAGAFSVAGGDIDLGLTVEFAGEQKSDGFIYTTYVNQNVNNQT
jgi:hypothetical protein